MEMRIEFPTRACPSFPLLQSAYTVAVQTRWRSATSFTVSSRSTTTGPAQRSAEACSTRAANRELTVLLRVPLGLGRPTLPDPGPWRGEPPLSRRHGRELDARGLRGEVSPHGRRVRELRAEDDQDGGPLRGEVAINRRDAIAVARLPTPNPPRGVVEFRCAGAVFGETEALDWARFSRST